MTKQNTNKNQIKKMTFNHSEFNESKTAYSCCYSGLTFYQPVRKSR